MKQDMVGVRTAQDLERKYDFVGMKKAIRLQEEGINKTNTELENFVNLTTSEMNNLQEQIDGNITTYYYSGVPTLNNLPVSEWESTEYNIHLGDLYYDKDTGYAYRFYLDSNTNEYGWVKITDSDVTEALALANAANDTADSKRRIFTSQPIPPYDNGDLWIKDMEIYICQISKPKGQTYEENDFIIATKYTDDTKAEEVDGKLTILGGTVTEVIQNINSLTTTMTNTQTIVDEQGNEIGTLQTKQTTIEQTVDDVNISVKNVQSNLETTNGKIETLSGTITEMSFDFSTKGLHIGNNTDPNNSLLDNTGIKVYNYTKLNAIFNNKGSGIEKLIVTGTAQIGYLKHVKSTKNGEPVTKTFVLKKLIEDLEDLEV